MKKFYLTIILTLPLFSEALLENLNKKLPGKSFVSIGVVQQLSTNYHNAQALNLSYSFTHRNNFGIEVDYTQSIDEAKDKETNRSADLSSLSVYSTYLLALDNNVGLKGKLGYAKNKHAEDGLSYGAEIIFQVTKNMGLSMSYQQINKNMKYLMINTVYRLKH